MKQIPNEFIIRALQRDGYEHAGFISSAASELILHLENPACRLPPEILPLSISAEPRAEHKKILTKRLPVIYCPPFVTFPQISFIG
jgi:hypothetical protein